MYHDLCYTSCGAQAVMLLCTHLMDELRSTRGWWTTFERMLHSCHQQIVAFFQILVFPHRSWSPATDIIVIHCERKQRERTEVKGRKEYNFKFTDSRKQHCFINPGMADEHQHWQEDVNIGGRTWTLAEEREHWRKNVNIGGRTRKLAGERLRDIARRYDFTLSLNILISRSPWTF